MFSGCLFLVFGLGFFVLWLLVCGLVNLSWIFVLGFFCMYLGCGFLVFEYGVEVFGVCYLDVDVIVFVGGCEF